MSRPPADPVDVGLLATQRATLTREYPVAGFPRLVASLARREGGAKAEFRFGTVSERPALDLLLRARVWLVCQRCLADYEQALESASAFVFVEDDDTPPAGLPEDRDAFAAPGGRARLASLVEDELLLALPLVPAHAHAAECAQAAAGGEVGARGAERDEQAQHPFAGLRDMLDR